MPQTEYLQIYQDAKEIVTVARKVIMRRLESGISVTLKPDNSFVTEADIEAETALREEISRRYPGHAIFGEEFPPTNPDAEFRWVLDPIDGTNNYAFGLPTFGTIVGVHRKNGAEYEQIVGIIDHPGFGQMYSAARGFGTYANDERITVRDYAKNELDPNEIITIGTRQNFSVSGHEELFDRFLKVHPNVRIYYDCYGHTRVIHGQAGAHICFNLNLWDVAASQVLMEEAHGSFVTLGSAETKKGTTYSVLFGRPKLVELLLPHFQLNAVSR